MAYWLAEDVFIILIGWLPKIYFGGFGVGVEIAE